MIFFAKYNCSGFTIRVLHFLYEHDRIEEYKTLGSFGGSMNSNHMSTSSNNLFCQERLQYLRNKFSRIYIAFVIGFLATAAFITVIQIVDSFYFSSENLAQNIYWQWALSLLPLYLCGLPTIYFCIYKMDVNPPRQNGISVGLFLLLLLIGRFFTVAGSLVSDLLVFVTESIIGKPIVDSTSELIAKTPVWLIFVAAVIIAPILEEFIYRKLIIDRLYVHGEAAAILVSAVIFALVHGNLHQVFYAFLNACILGWIYTRTGRLRYTILFHMITNFLGSIAILPLFDAREKLKEFLSNGDIGMEILSPAMIVGGYGILKLALAILGAVAFFLSYKRFLPHGRALDPLPKADAVKIILLNPGCIAFLAVSTFEIILSLF